MIRREDITGLVLAGGRGSRMGGVDKTFLLRDGQRVIERNAKLLREACGECVVVARDSTQATQLQMPQLRTLVDEVPGCGPLGGLSAAYGALNDDLFVLACDLPLLEAPLLQRMAETFQKTRPRVLLPRTRDGDGWRDQPEMKKLLHDAHRGNMKRPSEAASADLLALVAFYEHHVPQSQRNKVLDAQVRTFRHNREHYQKITANLLPVLSMLTSGDLGRSLSPDPFDAGDARPIMNFEKIERAGHVLYMCLDSLPDPSVATAIGALALADLAARAGMRYNLGGYRRISLFVDEVSNVINQPLIEILNKGAEGGIFTTCAMQTLADLAKRLGSEDAARMALGNLNNLIALRSKDRPTQDFVVETFGKTAIHSVRVGLSSGADAHLGDFSSSYSTQLTESFEEMVPADVLGKLPNLQYFASVSGGRIIKGRFPILDPDADEPRATRAAPPKPNRTPAAIAGHPS